MGVDQDKMEMQHDKRVIQFQAEFKEEQFMVVPVLRVWPLFLSLFIHWPERRGMSRAIYLCFQPWKTQSRAVKILWHESQPVGAQGN